VKILIACEESQEVCKAFRAKGHEAYSCDVQECSGGHPEWHILGDALVAIQGGQVTTMDGQTHEVGKWDMLIAHPPCTYLTNAGARHIWKDHQLQPDRVRLGIRARDLFMRFWWADIPRIVVENPVPSSIFCLPDYSQIVQPYQFGHPVTKKTCLWIKGLPNLVPTEIVEPQKGRLMTLKDGTTRRSCWEMDQRGSKAERAKARSKTFPGIAHAMADQWG
jgi:hypothetical protein